MLVLEFQKWMVWKGNVLFSKETFSDLTRRSLVLLQLYGDLGQTLSVVERFENDIFRGEDSVPGENLFNIDSVKVDG